MWSWLAVALFGIIHISAMHYENKVLCYIFKPLTLLLLLTILCLSGRGEIQFIWIAIGLLLFLTADVLGVLPRPKFKAVFCLQLLAFLFYSKGFWLQLYKDIDWWLPALLFAGSVILFLLLLPKLDTVIFPVVTMGLVSVQMAWAASAAWMSSYSLADLYACIACLIFIAIALLRAINRYHISDGVSVWSTGSYFIAQSLIVASVVTQV